MKILLVSDTHGHLKNFWTVYRKVSPVDLILHMGDIEGDEETLREGVDCPIEMVSGNNDIFGKEPTEKVLEIMGHKILMTHGHRRGVYRGLKGLGAAADEVGADLVLYGHTHIPDLSYIGDRVFVNPGSISIPRQEGRKPSFAILEIDSRGECHFSMNFLEKSVDKIY